MKTKHARNHHKTTKLKQESRKISVKIHQFESMEVLSSKTKTKPLIMMLASLIPALQIIEQKAQRYPT